MDLWKRPHPSRAPAGAGPVAAGVGRPRPVPVPGTGGLRPGRCLCGSRDPWLRRLLATTGRGALSGLVWLGLTGVALPRDTADEVRSWCAGPERGVAPCCTAALPPDWHPGREG